MDLISIPYVQSKKLAYGMSVSRIRLSFLNLPKIPQIRLDLFFKEYYKLFTQAMNKDKNICNQLVSLFLKSIWQSNFFEYNSDQDLMIDAFEWSFNNEDFKKKLSSLSSETQIADYMLTNITSVKEINRLINKKINEVSQNPRKLNKTFISIHNELKDIFEIYSSFVGLIRGFTDILGDTVEKDLKDYFNDRYHVCYGIINLGLEKHTNSSNALPLKHRLEKDYPILNLFLEKVFYNELRLIRNTESHTKITTSQEKIEDKIYIIENKQNNYYKEFTLGELWVLKSYLYQLLTLFFNLFFYLIPDDQLSSFISDILTFKKFDIGFDYPDLNLSPLMKEKEKKS